MQLFLSGILTKRGKRNWSGRSGQLLFVSGILLFVRCFDVAGSTYTCKSGTTIFGKADIELSNGKPAGTGYSKEECEQECAANAACKSFVYVASKTHCEMWSKTTGTSKRTFDVEHCIKKTGTLSCKDGHARTHAHAQIRQRQKTGNAQS